LTEPAKLVVQVSQVSVLCRCVGFAVLPDQLFLC
jgi:hypothetical protein